MNEQKQLDNAQEQLQMAAYAQQVTSNPAYKQAMLVIRGNLLTKFSKVSYKDVDDLLEIKRQMDTVERFQTLFEKTMEDGRIAEVQISKLKQILNKLRN